jgi:hypothetical protein
MAIYDLPGIINTPLNLAATPANIKAGCKVTGIYPYNRNVVPEEEFLTSYVTDRLTVPESTGASNGKGILPDGTKQPGSSSVHSPRPCPNNHVLPQL